MSSAKKYYAVARGRKTGIFSAWFGAGNAEEQVRGCAGARYKGFADIEEARSWLREQQAGPVKKQPSARKPCLAANPKAERTSCSESLAADPP